MIERHLDLRDRNAVIDFLDENAGYLPEADRKPYERAVADAEDGNKITTERLADLAKNLAAATWAERRALADHLAGEGADAEWEVLIEAVRPTTKLLLQRLHKNALGQSVDAVLASSDASMAIHEEEETEITLLRPELRRTLWASSAKKLAKAVDGKEAELEAMRKRLKRLRDYANKPSRIQEQLRAKLDALEDRIYFGNESIPVETMDAELRFDIEDLEIPPTDDALNEAETLPPRFVPAEVEQEHSGERDTEEQREEEKETTKLEGV